MLSFLVCTNSKGKKTMEGVERLVAQEGGIFHFFYWLSWLKPNAVIYVYICVHHFIQFLMRRRQILLTCGHVT